MAVAVFCAAILALHARMLTALGGALVEQDPLEKAQCAVVLGGDGFGQRIIRAAQLAKAGYVPSVMVDGPSALIGHESDMTITYAERQGYPASLFQPVWLPPGVNSTEAEARYIGDILKEKGICKILLVTSNYHTRRAARDFRRENRWLQVIAVAAPDRAFSPDGWWKSRDGQKTFLLEWTKTFATWMGV